MKTTGSINVTSENIFPIIKQFLYSDHEIFLRELVSNAVDATQKMKTLTSIGELKADLKKLRVEVILDKTKMDEARQRLQEGSGSLTKKVEKMKKLGRLSTKKQLPDSDDDVIG